MPEVTALKSFQGTEDEGYVRAGGKITVSATRHRELAANGLVPKVEGDEADEADDLPTLSGLNKDDLVKQAAVEGVQIETDDNKADIIRKIEAKRKAA